MTAETRTTDTPQLETGKTTDATGGFPRDSLPDSESRTGWKVTAPPESVSPGEALAAPLAGPQPRKSSILKQSLNLFCLCVLAFGSYFGVSHFLVQSVRVVGVSMTPTLHDSQS